MTLGHEEETVIGLFIGEDGALPKDVGGEHTALPHHVLIDEGFGVVRLESGEKPQHVHPLPQPSRSVAVLGKEGK
ncbi:hypothetical protein GUJ93_ZPchr0012g21875 [Zizania palustris]|uniref:Uncharacterized protein n=1 Tax=Zizania palustris TaxID=103762 RepID=A0A8J6BVP3_ZIZPA|nr:hypothetical protein GUJ93_ZPchr0012g21875 [Zizania palustris]